MKEICLNVLSYVAITILLIFGAIEEWKRGNKGLSIITAFVAIMMAWHAIENAKEINTNQTIKT